MAEFNLMSSLKGLAPNSAENEARDVVRFVERLQLEAATIAATPVAEQVLCRVKRKCRLVQAQVLPAAALTGAVTNFMTFLLAKRLAAAPATTVNLITYAVDTAGTDDAAAFGTKDLLAAATVATYVPTALASDFDFAEGDVLTLAITKTGAGMVSPILAVQATFEPRT